MKVVDVNLSSDSSFLKDYLSGMERSERFFHYTYEEGSFKKRADELFLRSFQREKLATYFDERHKQLRYYEEASLQIEKLKDERSVVVVGGQQAGLLTGPLYTVYKAMSIVHLAKEQESKLGIPVVPIFWVAGEDHDLDEIRYVFKQKGGRLEKHVYDHVGTIDSASNVILDQSKLQKWLKELFATFPETVHTKQLMSETERLAKESTTFVDFFIKMMNWFFGKEGLLFLDAHAPMIRRLEIDYFKTLIQEVENVQHTQQVGAKAFLEAGYGEPIETDEANAHLFLRVNEERRRLDYTNGIFSVKGTNLTFSKEELIDLLSRKPEWFSNNVVTRPLMQEWVLPVLAFISGPGELRYWATLKDVFTSFDLTIPPIVPRIGGTFVPTSVRKWLEEYQYNVELFIDGKGKQLREQWFSQVNEYPVHSVIERVKEQVDHAHSEVRQLAKEIDPLIAILSEKNATIIEEQIDFIGKKMEFFIRQKHEQMLSKFDEASYWLHPLEKPQERIFHPILFINEIGIEKFQQLLSQRMTLLIGHKAIYL